MASRKDTALTHTAENIGAALGHVVRRLDAWKKQRAEIANEIHALRKAAQAMLGDLGHRSARTAEKQRKGGRPKGYVMSEETKAKLRAAWQRRQANGSKQSKSAVRAMDAEANGRVTGTRRARVARGANR